jgi:hypothetical protein
MTSLGVDVRADGDALRDAQAVARETMRRARANVELLVDELPSLGWVFEDEPLRPPEADAVAELDRLESVLGILPLALRAWFEEVGQVNLAGRHPAWPDEYPDPLVVDAPFDHVLLEHEEWLAERGDPLNDGPSSFELPLAPDYLHKADVSGGPPYALVVPNPAADGLLLWERHQTTLVSYLRIAFAAGGMPGYGVSPDRPPVPTELVELGRRLRPL